MAKPVELYTTNCVENGWTLDIHSDNCRTYIFQDWPAVVEFLKDNPPQAYEPIKEYDY